MFVPLHWIRAIAWILIHSVAISLIIAVSHIFHGQSTWSQILCYVVGAVISLIFSSGRHNPPR